MIVEQSVVDCDCWCCERDKKRTATVLQALMNLPCPCADCRAAEALLRQAEHGASEVLS